MSHITDIMITISLEEGDNLVPLLNKWLDEHFSSKNRFEKIEGAKNRTWHIWQFDLFVGAFNYLFIEEFLTFFWTLDWEEETQLFMKDENEIRFQELKKGDAYQYIGDK